MRKSPGKTICFLLLFYAAMLPAQSQITLQPYATGLMQPLCIAHAGDSRLFVVEKAGRIRVLEPGGQVRSQPFLDISDRVRSSSNEQGMLGLAFHPDYAGNGFFFVHYINRDGDTQVSRFRVSSADAQRADPDSEKPVLRVDQPYANHNGGDLHFGPDGYLYIALGDGGSGGDPQNYAQNRQSFLGKMLRIDIDNGDPYAIPADNPFANRNDQTLDEIWALGLRNPWRFSFDRLTNAMWIGDVGQNKFEEIDYQPAGSKGGINYGWRCYEGFEPYNTAGCLPRTQMTFPVHAYAQGSNGCSVTGGVVYRGQAFPRLAGKYIYADYCSGLVWSLAFSVEGDTVNTLLLDFGNNDLVAFGEDQNGELYAAGLRTGSIYRITDPCAGLKAPPVRFAADVLSVPDTFAAYQWRLDGSLLSGANSPEYVPAETGAYSVELTDTRGCRVLSDAYLITGVAEAIGIRWWQVTPNPFQDRLRLEVELTAPAAFLVKLYDSSGRLVLRDSLERDSRWVRQYPLKDLKSGLYFLSLERGRQRVGMKLIKN